MDISQGQVDQYNKKVQNEGIPVEKMHAVRCELEGKEGELNGLKFDVIVVSVLQTVAWLITHSALQSVHLRITTLSRLSKLPVH